MSLTKVLITVKTYPTLSSKYEELVCTAGFLEDGSWIRIYPVQFRKRTYAEQYSKYQWVELDLVKNTKDFRPESYRPVSHNAEIKIIGSIESDKKCWEERRKIVLKKVYTNLSILIKEAKDKSIMTFLAVFKPTEIVDLTIEEVEPEWSKEKLQLLNQLNIFEAVQTEKPKVVRKLPYKFSYVFRDDEGKQSKLMIEDWEIGQLYWNCLNIYKDEKIAREKVREKYLNDFAKTKDLFFFLGTSQLYHLRAPNPFMIIGTFHPKFKQKEAVTQRSLF